MNARKVRTKFNNLQILLYSGCSSKILMGNLVKKIYPKKYAVIQCHTQVRNATTNLKVKLDLTLPALSATNVVKSKCHVDDSSKVI